MRDIIPSRRPSPTPAMPPEELPAPQPPADQPPRTDVPPHRRRLWWIIGGIVGLLGLVVIVAITWYYVSLRPLMPGSNRRERVTIVTGSSPAQIGQLLQQKHVIRSSLAFDIYTRLHGRRSDLQAGLYSLSPAVPLGTIVDQLVSGKVDQFSLTFYPGATLMDIEPDTTTAKVDVETVLERVGYKKAAIDAAFAENYDSPLFAGKPAGSSLEGYVYGETYDFSSDATVRQILERTFQEFYDQVVQYNLVAGFKKQGLNLYQGITLASIVQREVNTPSSADPSTDQRQVAQIFLRRLRIGMPLGSDVTAYYGADRAHQPRSVKFDSPYNTRIHPGLPPGPISSPSISALRAVADPASTDYLFFLSGDDGKMYYAHTDEQHEANIKGHCQQQCNMP